MKVMTNYNWYDVDNITCVEYDPGGGMHREVREIVLHKDFCEKSILISKEDVIALAKEFDLVVYKKGANL